MNAVILSLYIGFAVYEVFPFKKDVMNMAGGTPAMNTIIAIILYAAAVAGSHFLLRRLGVGHHLRRGLPMFVLGLLSILFLLALGYQVFAITKLVPTLPIILSQLFGPSQYFFWWFILPLVGLFFLA